MKVSDYDYNLPEERIAKFPPKNRGASRLLVLKRDTGAIFDSFYRNLPDFLCDGDVLVLNDTRVMSSRLFFELPDGRERELVVLEKHGDDPEKVMYRGKLHDGDQLTLKNHPEISLKITKILGGGIAEVETEQSLENLTEKFGSVPLPPYLHRDATSDDKERYQTIWAKNIGSAAAPTASLNMTKELLQKIEDQGVNIKYLTLHVGLGTFLPIRSANIEEHQMHSEWFEIPKDTLKAIKFAKKTGHRVIALGTTVARTLEYYGQTGETSGENDIFIYPGYKFTTIDALLTNFHAPKSTVLMLAAAFAGWGNLHNAYDHAVAENYNFLSYGDSMFIC